MKKIVKQVSRYNKDDVPVILLGEHYYKDVKWSFEKLLNRIKFYLIYKNNVLKINDDNKKLHELQFINGYKEIDPKNIVCKLTNKGKRAVKCMEYLESSKNEKDFNWRLKIVRITNRSFINMFGDAYNTYEDMLEVKSKHNKT